MQCGSTIPVVMRKFRFSWPGLRGQTGQAGREIAGTMPSGETIFRRRRLQPWQTLRSSPVAPPTAACKQSLFNVLPRACHEKPHTAYLTSSLCTCSLSTASQTVHHTFESILHSIDYTHCLLLVIFVLHPQRKPTGSQKVCGTSRAPLGLHLLTPPSTRACSHGQPSRLDPGQEPLFHLLHPRRWRPDAIDSFSSHSP